MTIYNRDEMERRKIEVDLSGSEGNAFVLMGIASRLYRKLGEHAPLVCEGKTEKEILDEMTSGDYDNLVNVLDHYFGDFIDIYR